ncbi:receptor-like protein 7 isoform X2 [Triticum urartu]|uniref:receptor-like protein 7 isoform X2 n=1 Tax=Triticum urartu TaxID=4572 RepID=UPI002042E9A8|nr:receptor-like protein 7 isoform X2 [Triticum urartu]
MSSRHPQLHLILLLLPYYCSTHTTANGGNGTTTQCIPDHSSSLLQLKHSFLNPNLSSWQQGSDCCHWEGVGCDRDSGQVITLDLSYRKLQSISDLSLTLFNLTSLRNLNLSGNDFGLTNLPRFGFERLIELLSLDLSNTRFFGQIPIGIAHLENLLTLDLSNNDLYLREPSFQTLIANMSNLRSLNLDTVQILSGASTWSVALADSVPLLQDLGLFQCSLSGPIHHSFSQLHFLATINLAANVISGQVPSFFAEFSFLSHLDLFHNNFEGQFPTKIFQLGNLTYLEVSYNPSLSVQLPDFPPGNILESLDVRETNLSIAIPDSLFHLNSLKALRLSTTGFPKHLITAIANLTSLESLWLSGSGIEKPMLSWIGRFKNLTDLLLIDYDFYGPIPWWIRNCTNLMFLELSACNLSGAIPSWIGNFTKLSFLDLSNNRLTGKIPTILFNLPSLEELQLSSNELYGTLEDIPDHLSTFMEHIDLSNNNLAGKIPKVLFTLPSLEALILSSNELCGTLEDIPDPISSFQYFIDLSNNNLAGHIPKSLFDLTRLQYLFLDSNQFEGTVDLSLLWKMKALDTLRISNNMLSVIDVGGGYPFTFIPRIRELGLAHCNLTKIPIALRNKLSGHIPRSICIQQDLDLLDLSYNNFSSVVPSCLMQGSSGLSTLKLRENHFHGMLPENIGEGCMLQTIDLNNNQIEGKIPTSLSNCQGLELLDVGNNQIVGSFPSWLGVLPHLRVLVLRSNQLSGTIRDIKGDHTINNYFASLQILDLASNNFSGNLPNGWFNELKAMMENVSDEGQVLGHDANSISRFYQDTVTITFKGFDLSFTKILRTFKAIDLSNNSFDGPLPESIGRFVSLHGLNASYNNFTGQIPYQYSNLSQLESLDLSWNQITGEIPQELTSLTSLEWLNLSYNNLYGRIPQGNQFSTFSDSSFEGNLGLCGVQLSKHCDNQSSIAPSEVAPPESDSLWQDKLGVILLFAFVGLGFGVGFALSFLLRLYCRMEGWVCKQS